MITVMLVDDHTVVRDGLATMLAMENDITVVAEAGSGADALACFAKFKPNIILMDLLLPDRHGTEVIGEICRRSSDSFVIVLTSVSGDEEIHRALDAGARGFLFKDALRTDLVAAIRSVKAGKRYIPPEVGAILAEHLSRPALSAREMEVLKLVAVGQRNKEIAYHLQISEETVHAHVKRILQKLQASDRTEAVHVALMRGIIRL